MLRWLIGIILGEIICESSNWQHIHVQRLKITILGANWQLFRLERIAKCSYISLSTQNIKCYWFVMKIKKFLLPIWWYNRGLFPLRNKYFGVFVWEDVWEEHVNNMKVKWRILGVKRWDIVSWEPEGRYQRSKMFRWKPCTRVLLLYL